MITVQSEKGEGAVFDIFLPISTDQLPIEKA
jgi:signal transduction histidine kinase